MNADRTRSSGRIPALALRRLAAVAALVAAVAHVPVTPEHLREAPYMGVLFIVLSVACVVLAAALLLSQASLVVVSAALICAAAVAGYVLTRLIAFPMLADDVGNWLEPLGVVSIVSEAVVVGACLVLLRRHVAAPRPLA